MKSFQEKVLAEVERIAAKCDLDLVREYDFGNCGTIYAQYGWETVATLRYDFQTGGSKLLINGAQHGPPGPDNYFVTPRDYKRLHEFFWRWKQVCREENLDGQGHQ